MEVRVVDHPLAAARLTTLRDERTDNAAFRAALRDLTLMLVYEAMSLTGCPFARKIFRLATIRQQQRRSNLHRSG